MCIERSRTVQRAPSSKATAGHGVFPEPLVETRSPALTARGRSRAGSPVGFRAPVHGGAGDRGRTSAVRSGPTQASSSTASSGKACSHWPQNAFHRSTAAGPVRLLCVTVTRTLPSGRGSRVNSTTPSSSASRTAFEVGFDHSVLAIPPSRSARPVSSSRRARSAMPSSGRVRETPAGFTVGGGQRPVAGTVLALGPGHHLDSCSVMTDGLGKRRYSARAGAPVGIGNLDPDLVNVVSAPLPRGLVAAGARYRLAHEHRLLTSDGPPSLIAPAGWVLRCGVYSSAEPSSSPR